MKENDIIMQIRQLCKLDKVPLNRTTLRSNDCEISRNEVPLLNCTALRPNADSSLRIHDSNGRCAKATSGVIENKQRK